MPSLASLITSKTRKPSAKVYLNGKRWYGIISLRASQAFGSSIAGGSVVGRNPPIEPQVGMTISWTWGYNGQEVAGFTGEVSDILDSSYPNRWTLEVKDVLWRADRVQQVIATDPLNEITAKTAIEYILTHYGGIASGRLQIPNLQASGSEWAGSSWKLGILTPVAWGDTETNSGGTTALKACQEICACLGYWLYADASGIIRAKQLERRPSPSALRTFQRGVDLLVQGAPERRQNVDGVKNRIVVKGANTGVEGAQITDAWQTKHPLLPSGVYQEETFSSFLIEYVNESEAGAASATAIAKRILKVRSRVPNIIRARTKADPRISVGATVGITDSAIGLNAKNFFVYGVDRTLDAQKGAFDDQLTLDGGTGSDGYTTIPNPEASFSWRLVRETLDGTAVVEVFLDGSGSTSPSEGEIVSWDWSTATTVYGSTPSTPTGEHAVLIFPASAGSAEITLTVTDTTSKTGSVTQTVDFTGAGSLAPIARTMSVAFGAAWAVTPDGGAAWNVETTNGDAVAVPPIGAGFDDRAATDSAETYGLLATRGSGGTGVRQTLDALATASTNLASIGTAIRCMWVNEASPARVWVGAGDTVYRSTDGGSTFTAMAKPAAGTNINWIIEDPALDDSVFVACGANLYHATAPTVGWAVLYAGPTGATARQFVRSRDGQVTWVCYTGTFMGSPIQRVETASEGDIDPAEVRALALDRSASADVATLYCVSADDPPQIWSVDGLTGLSAVQLASTLPSGSTAQHMLADPDVDLLYLAAFDSEAVGTGGVYKLFLPDTLLKWKAGATGQQAHMLGFGGKVAGPGEFLIVTGNGVSNPNPGGVYHYKDGVWTLRNSGLPTARDWQGIVADPLDADRWIVWDRTEAYISEDAGASWSLMDDPWAGAGSGGGYTRLIAGAAFSPATAGEWTIWASHRDNGILQTYGHLARGSGTTRASHVQWTAVGFLGAGPYGIVTAAVYGAGGELICAHEDEDENGHHIAGTWRLVAAGAVAVGSLIATTNTSFAAIDTNLDPSTRIAGVPSKAADAGDLWYAADYHAAPTTILMGGDWDENDSAAATSHGIYITTPAALQRIPLPDTPAAEDATTPGVRTDGVRSDRQTKTLVAVVYSDTSPTNDVLVAFDGDALSSPVALPGKAFGVSRTLNPFIEVIRRET